MLNVRCSLFILGACTVLVSLLAMTIGPAEIKVFEIGPALLAKTFGGEGAHEQAARQGTILLNIRLPRIVLGMLVGAALALAGAVLQALFRNPLADPGLIGVSSGGALGAVFVIVLGSSWLPVDYVGRQWFITLFAMVGGVGTTYFIYRVGLVNGRPHMTTLLLTGLAVNAFVGALIGLMIDIASSAELKTLTYWSLGSLDKKLWSEVWVAMVFVGVPSVLVYFYVHPLNAFLLGEAEAYHLGVRVDRVKRNLIFIAAAMVGASVALCGIIGFVGLIVPHLMRLLLGPDHRILIPGSALLGALVLVSADLIARSVVQPAELPIGIITALLGAPFFLGLLWRAKLKDFG